MAASYLNLSAARPKVNLAFALINSAIGLLAVYPLVVRYGATGAAMSGLLGTAVIPLFFLYTHNHVLHVSSYWVFRKSYLPSLLGCSVVGVVAYFILVPNATSLISTLGLMTATAVTGALVSAAWCSKADGDAGSAQLASGLLEEAISPQIGHVGAQCGDIALLDLGRALYLSPGGDEYDRVTSL